MQIFSRRSGTSVIWTVYLIMVYLMAVVLINLPNLGTLAWAVEMFITAVVVYAAGLVIQYGLRKSVSTYSCTDVGKCADWIEPDWIGSATYTESVYYDPKTGISHGEATH